MIAPLPKLSVPLIALIALVTACAGASGGAAEQAQPGLAPEVIRLPNGFAPEGIAVDDTGQAYLGDRETGALHRIDLRTGKGVQLGPPTGRGVQGMKFRDGRLYAAGRGAGDARVIDATTGQQLASLPLAGEAAQVAQGGDTKNVLVNDVLLTQDAWWLTESRNPVLYRVALPADGRLPTPSDVRALRLHGDWVNDKGINANGIAPTPDGTGLLVVQSNTGALFRVDPNTGRATRVNLGGEELQDGDGLALVGNTLFVAQNESNTLTTVELDPDATKGRVINRITDPRFDGPTTIAVWSGRLYIPNARFDEEPGPSVEYTVVGLPQPNGRPAN